jgi:hypothetical protein
MFWHWSQVKEIKKKSSELKNCAKLIENKQLKDFVSLWARVKNSTELFASIR